MESLGGTAPGHRAARAVSGAAFSWTHIFTLELMLFLGLWFFYGTLINVKNIDDFGQSMTEAIVDEHRFSVEDLSAWPVRGDVFGLNGHVYSNKNPGQAFISSVAYVHLRLLGISYAGDKIFAGALVIFFSSCLLTALAAIALYRLARDLAGEGTIWPLAATLVWALCTTAMAFSGVAWHDVLATALLVIAVYLLRTIRNISLAPAMARNLSVVAGFLLGMTITTSMTFFFMVVLFGVYFLTMRRWPLLAPFVFGGLAGVAPMLFYNAVNFGNPFTFPAVAYFQYSGMPPDVYFFLEWHNFESKVIAYFTLINWYVPVLWLGLVGLVFLPSRVRREQLFVIGAIAVLVLYMFNVQGLGVCGYGPRYLMPIMPFCSLGIIGLGRIPTKALKLLMGAAVSWIAFLSFRVNVVGAIGGAMFCNYAASGYPEYINKISTGGLSQFPLLWLLLPFSVLWCILAFYLLLPSGDT